MICTHPKQSMSVLAMDAIALSGARLIRTAH